MITRDEVFSLLGTTASRWNAHNAPRLGASLAYYALLSLAPLSILLVAICSLVFSRSTAESNLLQHLERIVGHSGANTLRAVFDASRHHPGSGAIAGVAAIAALFFGASGVFVELRDSLNLIWDVPASAWHGWRGLLVNGWFPSSRYWLSAVSCCFPSSSARCWVLSDSSLTLSFPLALPSVGKF